MLKSLATRLLPPGQANCNTSNTSRRNCGNSAGGRELLGPERPPNYSKSAAGAYREAVRALRIDAFDDYEARESAAKEKAVSARQAAVAAAARGVDQDLSSGKNGSGSSNHHHRSSTTLVEDLLSMEAPNATTSSVDSTSAHDSATNTVGSINLDESVEDEENFAAELLANASMRELKAYRTVLLAALHNVVDQKPATLPEETSEVIDASSAVVGDGEAANDDAQRTKSSEDEEAQTTARLVRENNEWLAARHRWEASKADLRSRAEAAEASEMHARAALAEARTHNAAQQRLLEAAQARGEGLRDRCARLEQEQAEWATQIAEALDEANAAKKALAAERKALHGVVESLAEEQEWVDYATGLRGNTKKTNGHGTSGGGSTVASSSSSYPALPPLPLDEALSPKRQTRKEVADYLTQERARQAAKAQEQALRDQEREQQQRAQREQRELQRQEREEQQRQAAATKAANKAATAAATKAAKEAKASEKNANKQAQASKQKKALEALAASEEKVQATTAAASVTRESVLSRMEAAKASARRTKPPPDRRPAPGSEGADDDDYAGEEGTFVSVPLDSNDGKKLSADERLAAALLRSSGNRRSPAGSSSGGDEVAKHANTTTANDTTNSAERRQQLKADLLAQQRRDIASSGVLEEGLAECLDEDEADAVAAALAADAVAEAQAIAKAARKSNSTIRDKRNRKSGGSVDDNDDDDTTGHISSASSASSEDKAANRRAAQLQRERELQRRVSRGNMALQQQSEQLGSGPPPPDLNGSSLNGNSHKTPKSSSTDSTTDSTTDSSAQSLKEYYAEQRRRREQREATNRLLGRSNGAPARAQQPPVSSASMPIKGPMSSPADERAGEGSLVEPLSLPKPPSEPPRLQQTQEGYANEAPSEAPAIDWSEVGF